MDVLMKSTDLLFIPVPIPQHLTTAIGELGDLDDFSAISPDGENCCQYIIWVAEVAQVETIFFFLNFTILWNIVLNQ